MMLINVKQSMMQSSKLTVFIILSFILGFNSYMLAGTETSNSRISGAQLTPGALAPLFTAYDNKFYSAIESTIPNSRSRVLNSTGKIIFGINHESNLFVNDEYKVKVGLSVVSLDKFQNIQTGIPTYLELEIEYKKTGSFKDISLYSIDGSHRIIITQINSITATKLSDGSPLGYIPQNLFLELEIETERIYELLPTASLPEFVGVYETIGHTAINHGTGTPDYELDIWWNAIQGSEEYQLEYAFINDYSDNFSGANWNTETVDNNTATIPSQTVLSLFESSATRVTVTDNHYIIPLVYDRGYLVYRVRAVGRNFNDNVSKIYGAWSSDSYSPSADVSIFNDKYYVLDNVHEADKNWNYAVQFAENGKRKEGISYADGTLKSRQEIGVQQSSNTTVVGQTIYDYQGRAAIQVLPAPTENNDLTFQESFNKNTQTTPTAYTKADFDEDETNSTCNTLVSGMSNTSGSSKYYSANSDFMEGNQAYTPDAENYPFVQIEYSADNTGRISKQGGVGPTFQLGGGHETEYYYGQPEQQELDRLFGSEVGDWSHYKKNLSVDPNGQVSVTYMDLNDRVIATALAGDAPTSLQAIEGSNTNAPITAEWLNSDNANLPDYNIKSDNSLVFTKTLPVASAGNYTFHYNIEHPRYTNDCTPALCYDCAYDLDITIYDNCQIPVYSSGNIEVGYLTNASGQFDTDCESISDFNFTTAPDDIVLYLTKGSYTVVKTLTVNQAALEYYTQQYINNALTTSECIESLDTYITNSIGGTNFTTLCEEMDCATCSTSIGTLSDYKTAVGYNNMIAGITDNAEITNIETHVTAMWQQAIKDCMEPCNPANLCQAQYEQLLLDVSPGRQYAKFDRNTTTNAVIAPDLLSLFNPSNKLPSKCADNTYKPYWRNPYLKDYDFSGSNLSPDYYYDADGVTRSKIYLTINGSSYYPAICSNCTPAAVVKFDAVKNLYYVYPNELANIADFIDNWKPSWAISLVSYHPEYIYYEWCRKNNDPSQYTFLNKTSDEFDNYLKSITTYSGAVTAGVLNILPSNTSDIISQDPYFVAGQGTNANSHTHQTSKMMSILNSNNYQGSGYNIKEMASVAVKCSHQFYGTLPASCASFSSTDPQVANQIWQLYRDSYLSEKQKLQQIEADEFARMYEGPGGYNGCIEVGSSSFDPYTHSFVRFGPSYAGGLFNWGINTGPYESFQDQINDPCLNGWGFYNPDNACSYVHSYLYADRTKRFRNAGDLVNTGTNLNLNSNANVLASLNNTNDYDWYQQTGQCPLTHQLELFLNGLAHSNTLNSADIDISSQPFFGVKLYDALVAGQPTPFRTYHFEGSSVNEIFTGTFAYYFPPSVTRNVDACATVSMELPTLSYTDNNNNTYNFTWADVDRIGGMRFISFNAGISSFVTYVYVDYDNNPQTPSLQLTVYGTCCFNISDCDFDKICTPSQVAVSLQELFNNLNAQDLLVNSTGVGLYTEPTTNDLTAQHIKPQLTTQYVEEITWTSVADAAGLHVSLDATDQYSNTVKSCSFNFDPLPSGISFSNDIVSFADIKPDENDATKCWITVFYKDVSNNLLSTRISITNTEGCFNFGTCELPVPIECQAPEVKITHDLEEFLNHLPQINCLSTGQVTQSFSQLFAPDANGQIPASSMDINCSLANYPYYSSNLQSAIGNNNWVNVVFTQAPAAPEMVIQFTSNDRQNAGCQLHIDLNNVIIPGMTSSINTYPAFLSYFKGFSNIVIDENASTNGYTYFKIQMNFEYINETGQIEYESVNVKGWTTCFEMRNCNQCTIADEVVYFEPMDNLNTSSPGFTSTRTYTTCNGNIGYNDYSLPVNSTCLGAEFLSEDHTNAGTGKMFTFLSNPGVPHEIIFEKSFSNISDLENYELTVWAKFIYGASNETIELVASPTSNNPGILLSSTSFSFSNKQTPWIKISYTGMLPTDGNGNVIIRIKSHQIIGNPGIYALDDIYLAKKGCTPHEIQVPTPPTTPPVDQCIPDMTIAATMNGSAAYYENLNHKIEEFKTNYLNHCLGSVKEYLTASYGLNEYHYTLYYYDQAGNLVRTVPPGGVQIVSNPSDFTAINSDRNNGTHNFKTNHKLVTKYEYNSLNQLLKQYNPDHEYVNRWEVFASDNGLTGINVTDIGFTDATNGILVGNNGTEGVLYSTHDGGNTWSAVAPGGFPDLNSIRFVNSLTGFAAGNQGKIMITGNGGLTWTTQTISGLSDEIADLYFSTTTNGFILTTTGKLYTTTDGGTNWTQSAAFPTLTTGAVINRLKKLDATTFAAVGSKGTIIVSTDNGTTWNHYNTIYSPALNNLINITSIEGDINNDFYLTGKNSNTSNTLIVKGAVDHSVTPAVTVGWTVKVSGGDELKDIVFDKQSTPNLFAIGNNGRILKSVNGNSWQTITSSVSQVLNKIAFEDATHGYAVMQNGHVLTSTDGGATWSEVTPATNNRPLKGLYTSGTNVYVAGQNNTILASNDYGVTYTELSGTHIGTLAALSMAQDNSGSGMAVGAQGTILKTTDNGATWNVLSNSGAVDYKGVAVVSANEAALVGSLGNMLVTTDGGTTYTTHTAGTATLNDVCYNGSLYHAVGEFNGSNASYVTCSLNGSTFSNIGISNANNNLNAVYFNGANGYVAGNQGTIYTSSNGGTSWTARTSGVTDNLNDIFFTDNLTGYSFGDNGAMLKTTDGGVNWLTQSSGAAGTGILNSAALSPNGQIFVAANSGNNSNVSTLLDQTADYSVRYWYDHLGRIAISQNSKQYNKPNRAFSYTRYDALGRMTEVGEVAQQTANSRLEPIMNEHGVISQSEIENWIALGTKSEITSTYYDNPVASDPGFVQDNLRNRVSASKIDEEGDGVIDAATYYTYDIHGNVNSLLQENNLVGTTFSTQRYKRIDYEYELISGNVNKVTYQKNQADQFIHKYRYDADNRLIEVYTSSDGYNWDKDANYNYYQHGPLARTELATTKVQGVDYAYTLAGMPKGVNSNVLYAMIDQGKDGYTDSDVNDPYAFNSIEQSMHGKTGRDAFGFSLDYYYTAANASGGTPAIYDYKAINALYAPETNGSFEASVANNKNTLASEAPNLYNGNIKHMITSIKDLDPTNTIADGTALPLLTAYKYDQLNRLKQMTAFSDIDVSKKYTGSAFETGFNQWGNATTGTHAVEAYKTNISYDKNGNITTLNRNGKEGAIDMDQLSYNYDIDANDPLQRLRSNKLYSVNDAKSSTNYNDDIDDEGVFVPAPNSNLHLVNTANNYGYDEQGNLIRDNSQEIANIEWNVYGKVKKISRTALSQKPDLEFVYDAFGRRVLKIVKPKQIRVPVSFTYYVHDADGNVLTTYGEYFPGDVTPALYASEQNIFGSERLGAHMPIDRIDLMNPPVAGPIHDHIIGEKQYELSNHLGNVLSTVSDRKIAYAGTGGTGGIPVTQIAFYEAEIINTQDYYAGGMLLPGRHYAVSGQKYRYGFNRQEQDDDISGVSGANTTAQYWEYDSRLIRRWNVDPVFNESFSPYACFNNNPIIYSDPNGDFPWTALILGAVHAGVEIAGQRMSGKSLREIDWVDVGAEFLKGAMEGSGIGAVRFALGTGVLNLVKAGFDISAKEGNKNVLNNQKSGTDASLDLVLDVFGGRLIGKVADAFKKPVQNIVKHWDVVYKSAVKIEKQAFKLAVKTFAPTAKNISRQQNRKIAHTNARTNLYNAFKNQLISKNLGKVAEKFIDAAGEALENVTGDGVKKYVENNRTIQKWRNNYKEFRDRRRYNLNRRHVNAQF